MQIFNFTCLSTSPKLLTHSRVTQSAHLYLILQLKGLLLDYIVLCCSSMLQVPLLIVMCFNSIRFLPCAGILCFNYTCVLSCSVTVIPWIPVPRFHALVPSSRCSLLCCINDFSCCQTLLFTVCVHRSVLLVTVLAGKSIDLLQS